MIEIQNVEKKRKNIQIDVGKLFVYLAIFLLCFNYLLYNFFGFSEIKNYVRIVAILFILASLFFKRELTLFNCVLLVTIAFIIAGNGVDSLNIAACFLLAISIDFDVKTFDIVHKVSLLLSIVVLVSLMSGVVKGKQYVDTQERIRNTLGFGNVNSASLFFASYIICFFMSKEKIKVYHIIYALAISLILYLKTDSRTALGAVIVFLVVYITLLSRFNNVFKNLFLLLEIVLFISPIFWILPLSSSMDKFLSFRVTYFRNYIESNDLANLLLGGTQIADIDNFFLILLFNVGIVGYLLLCYLIFKSSKNLIHSNKNKELALIITILTVGLVESTGVRVELGMTMLFWVVVIYYVKRQDRSLA